MKSSILIGMVKYTDAVIAVGGLVLCSCFLFPVSEASSIAVGGGNCTHSEYKFEDCDTHPDAPGSCNANYYTVFHLAENLKDNAVGDDEDVCTANNCVSMVKPGLKGCTEIREVAME